MLARRRFKQFKQLEHRLTKEANRLRDRAKGMSPGLARDEVLYKAQEAANASAVSKWLRSPVRENRPVADLD
jgi:hypothetical protein